MINCTSPAFSVNALGGASGCTSSWAALLVWAAALDGSALVDGADVVVALDGVAVAARALGLD
jgi:hypothetical protein